MTWKDSKDSTKISILCKFWEEDGVWNATAMDLPVAVFGETFEEALGNMSDALDSHVSAMINAGKIEELSEKLPGRPLFSDDLLPNSPLVNLLVVMDQPPKSAMV